MFRVSIHELNNYGCFSSPKDFDDFKDFIKYLSDKEINKFDLKYYSILDDIPDFY